MELPVGGESGLLRDVETCLRCHIWGRAKKLPFVSNCTDIWMSSTNSVRGSRDTAPRIDTFDNKGMEWSGSCLFRCG